jgi:FixJ family two-component response regulator
VATDLISIVDDDESIRRTTKLLIESFGFRAAAFESAENFLKSELLCHTSCVLVDIQMPGMNGLELQRHLAAKGFNTPLIFITVYDNEELRGRAVQAGAVAFLGKPYDDEELFRAISVALPDESKVADIISVVDDDPSVRSSMKLLIESFGFQAAIFESAESFLDAEQLHRTGCVVADLQMPGMNGLQLQRYLAAANWTIPMIFITAYDDKESRRKALQAGATAFLNKPFTDEQLFKAIRTAIARPNNTATH